MSMEQIKGRVLALDFGSRRIGVAISDPLGITAQQLPAVQREGDRKDIEEIAELAKEYQVDTVLIGLPLLPGGTEGTQAAKARAFARKVHERLGIPVVPWDERFTTAQAERHLVSVGLRREKRKEIRDSLAAAFLLQSALDARNRK
jgi:putative Holliday junction resolvase